MLVQSAAARWVLSAAVAVAVAAATAALLRPFGPIGLGRQLLDRPPISLDPTVAAVGLAAVGALVLGVGLVATWFAAHAPAGPTEPTRGRSLPSGASPTASTGLVLGFSARNGRWTVTTVLAVALAVAAAVASATVVSSLRELTSEPVRFGASWDLSIASVIGPASTGEIARAVADTPGVVAAGGLIGNDATIGDDDFYAYAIEPVDGLPEGITPVMTEGRPPAAPGEVALGALTMERAGVEVGDTVSLTYLDQTDELTVVGEAIIHDGYEDLPGVGAIVDHRWLRAQDAQVYASDLIVRFEPAAREDGIASLMEAFPDTAVRPPVPDGVRDLERIDMWPAVLTAFAGALAAATFAHALIVTVRRQWRQLGVLRALGFSRRQVRRSVAWLATLSVVAAVLIGLPLGIGFGRWGWSRFAHNLGVPSHPEVPLVAPMVVVVVSVLVAQLIALPVGWRAARGRPADALRTE